MQCVAYTYLSKVGKKVRLILEVMPTVNGFTLWNNITGGRILFKGVESKGLEGVVRLKNGLHRLQYEDGSIVIQKETLPTGK